jgi:hypothetical protein
MMAGSQQQSRCLCSPPHRTRLPREFDISVNYMKRAVRDTQYLSYGASLPVIVIDRPRLSFSC